MPHGHAPSESYSLLLTVLRNHQNNGSPTQIIFAVSPPQIKDIPFELFRVAKVLESDPCLATTQLICVYDPKWQDWIIQYLSRRFWEGNQYSPSISTNLTRIYPSYLLYLN